MTAPRFRAAFAALAGLVLVPLAVTPVAAQETEPGSGLVAYTVRATAPGLGIEGLYKDVALTVPEVTSTLSTGGVGAGLAALAWPGPVVGNLGTTILVLKSSAPPGVTVLNDPVKAETRSGGVQHATYTELPGTVMTSSATHEAVTASSHSGSTSIGSTSLPLGVGGFSGDSNAVLRGAHQVDAAASSAVTDVRLAGGLLTIGSIASTARAITDGTTAAASGSTTVAGVRVAGLAAAIDGTGLHLAGTSLQNPIAQRTLDSAVKSLGLSVLLTPARTVREGASASFDAGALVIELSRGASHYALTLGRASVSLGATPAPVLGAFPLPPLPTSAGAAPQTAPAAGLPGTGPLPSLSTDQPQQPAPTVLGQVANVAEAAVSLAGGAPAPMVLALLALGGLLVAAMRRLPDRLLAEPLDCEEGPS